MSESEKGGRQRERERETDQGILTDRQRLMQDYKRIFNEQEMYTVVLLLFIPHDWLIFFYF